MLKNISLIILTFLTICSCSLRNLPKEDNVNNLPNFHLETSKTIEGAELYSELEKLLSISNHSRYNLNISLNYKVSLLSISKKSEITQESIEQSVSITLYDKIENRDLIKENFTTYGTVGTTLKPYSDYQEINFTRIDMAKEASQEVLARLMIYFSDK